MRHKGDEGMKVKIKRVWGADISPYKTILDKHNASYEKDETDEHFATIEITDLGELFSLAKEIDEDLIISRYGDNQVEIYDDYVE
jgi:hypothetical protein